MRSLLGRIVKRFCGKALSPTADDLELQLINDSLDQEFGSLPISRINTVSLSNGTQSAQILTDRAQFYDFLSQYAIKKSRPEFASELNDLSRNHPVLVDCADIVLDYLGYCEGLPASISGIMRRLVFRHLSVLNKNTKVGILEYRKGLPRVGMFYFPNSEPRDFLIDALNGIAVIDDMEPGKLLERTWLGRPYDFQRYQTELRERIKRSLCILPEELVSRYPSREWIESEVIENCQYQFALNELVRRGEWDLIFIGSPEQPLGLTLYDFDDAVLPPVVYLCHGMLAGDPVMDFWLKFDKVLTRGAVEESYCRKLGFESDRIVNIGSISLDCYPSLSALNFRRQVARSRLGLDEHQLVVVYALTYDIYRSDHSLQIIDLLTSSLKRLAFSCSSEKLVVYLKYHPSPSSDSTFSYSRNQFPLSSFVGLNDAGVSIRLSDDLETLVSAADCFIAHESTTLLKALENAVPTLSILYNPGDIEPILGRYAYENSKCHMLKSVADSADDVAASIFALLQFAQAESYAESRQVWQSVFKYGRTEGLSIVATLVKELISSRKANGQPHSRQ